ncbi:hypothetical protein [Amycolatopsis magusensis]|uniref:ParB-like nuclease domain-containing protein n=1 Tax=Amycolatopsis magusensis TaxID=882444 RepID=A0ABS4PM96_9PSEU|nr:hypothetical protein [Amycolatopsis magusensis]MBP2179978.1 hypothetical protein [Amycolatopsis magusensis]
MEEVTVTGGAGVVEVRGSVTEHGYVESLLYLGGAVALLDSSAYEGSIGRLIARAPFSATRPEVADRLRIALATGQIRRPLTETLRPLTALLADGRYELSGPEPLFTASADQRGWYVMGVEADEPKWIYEEQDDRYLVPTDVWPPEDESRVGYYRTAISAGYRPTAVLLHLAGKQRYSGYILDGHHKVAAYLAEGVVPQVVRISRVDAPAITAADVRGAFSAKALAHRDFGSLLRVLER